MTPFEALAWRVNAGVWARYLSTCQPGCCLLLDHDQCLALVELFRQSAVIIQPAEREPAL